MLSGKLASSRMNGLTVEARVNEADCHIAKHANCDHRFFYKRRSVSDKVCLSKQLQDQVCLIYKERYLLSRHSTYTQLLLADSS